MKKDVPRIISLLAISILFLLSPCAISATAQTCRVAMGNTAGGCRSYMEVYEYDYVSEKPEFPGGSGKLTEFINHHRVYPKQAYKKGVQGRVTCSFVVNTDGSVSHLKVLRSVEESLNQEALRIFSLMPSWKPGVHNGVAVPVRVVCSVPFRK